MPRPFTSLAKCQVEVDRLRKNTTDLCDEMVSQLCGEIDNCESLSRPMSGPECSECWVATAIRKWGVDDQ